MSDALVNEEYLKAIANAIREKTGIDLKYKPSEMATAIANIDKNHIVRRKINIVNPSSDKQVIHVDYLSDIASITDSAVIDVPPKIHSYIWVTQGFKGGVLDIEEYHKFTEDEITITATEAVQQYKKGDKVSLDYYYKQLVGTKLTELPETNANYLKSVYPTSMDHFLDFSDSYYIGKLDKNHCIIDLRELDTRYCTNMSYAFCNISENCARNIEILGIESLDVSNVTDFSNTFQTSGSINYSKKLDLSKWDVRKGTTFSSFAADLDTLNISSFGENIRLNTGYTTMYMSGGITNLIIDGKFVFLDSSPFTLATNLYVPHDLLDKYKELSLIKITNYKSCEKLIKATIPEGYAISFNNSITPEEDGIAYIPYKTTKATYCMINPNYLPVTGEIDVSSMARSEQKDVTLEDTVKDTSGYTLTVNTIPSNATVKITYRGITLVGNKIMVPANTEVNVEITCADYKTINKTITVTEKAQTDNNTMTAFISDHANFANNYIFSHVTSTLLDDDNFAIDTDKKCLYSKKAYNANNGISTGYIHIPSDLFDSDRTLKVSVRTNADMYYDTSVILVGNINYTITSYYRISFKEGSTVTLNSNSYLLLYNSYGKGEAVFRTVSTTLKAKTEYYIIFAYTKNKSRNINADKMFIESIDIE